jgi:hypothetical protein
MSLLFRLAIYVPVLFCIAVVVCGQHHVTAKQTVRDALRRTVRWLAYSAAIVVTMTVIELLFIG